MNQAYGINRSTQSIAEENARFMAGVYKWMTIGILLTAIVSYYVGHTPALYTAILQNKIMFYGLIIAELGAVFYLSSRINKMSGTQATVIFLLYSLLSGLTLSMIFLVYAQQTIESAFLVTAFAFGGLSAFGYVTKRDLGPIGTFCTMGLWGLIGFSLISLFFPSLRGGQMGMIYNLAGLVIFCGLTAYDTQKIKETNIIGNEGTEEDHKETIMGALELYLDFINLFLFILRLMGGGSRRN
jgi:FtsH-binding integral membrane protein